MIVAEKHGTVRKNRCFWIEKAAVPQIDFNIYGNDLVGKLQASTNQRYYYLKDHLGSVRVTLDQSGNIDSWTDYYPFGKEARGSNTANEPREQFTGKERDSEIGLDYFGARYYNAEILRWISPDPLKEKHPDWNPYNYVLGNPVALIDPDGRQIFFNEAGKHIGTIPGSDELRLSRATTSEAFNTVLATEGGADLLMAGSRAITYDEAAASQQAENIYNASAANGYEVKSYIVLDTKESTLGIEIQPKHPKDGPNKSVNEADNANLAGQSFKTPKGAEKNKVVVGQLHGHGSENPEPRVSGDDATAAKTLGVPVYAVDKKNIHKVDQHGNKKNKLPKNTPILRDALETSGGSKQK